MMVWNTSPKFIVLGVSKLLICGDSPREGAALGGD